MENAKGECAKELCAQINETILIYAEHDWSHATAHMHIFLSPEETYIVYAKPPVEFEDLCKDSISVEPLDIQQWRDYSLPRGNVDLRNMQFMIGHFLRHPQDRITLAEYVEDEYRSLERYEKLEKRYLRKSCTSLNAS